jgi:hypothetical protein
MSQSVGLACAIRLQSAGALGELDRYIGYWQPYATSHIELDQDTSVREEVRNAARTLLEAVLAQREGGMSWLERLSSVYAEVGRRQAGLSDHGGWQQAGPCAGPSPLESLTVLL